MRRLMKSVFSIQLSINQFTSVILALTTLLLIAALILPSGCAKQEKEIKVGAILPLTGDSAIYGEIAQNSFELAAEEINSKGGISGYKISILYEDSQAKPELAVSSANKLITADKVFVIVGAMASTEVNAIAPILNDKKVVLVSPSATDHDITDAGDYIFRTIVSDIYDGTAMARFAYNEKGIKSSGVFYITEAGPQGVAEAFIDEFQKLGGAILNAEQCNRGDKDFRTQISKIHEKKPEAIYFALYPRETELFIKQTKEMGIKEILLSHQLVDDPEVLSKVGKAADGIIFTTPKLTAETGDEVVKSFYKNYKEKYGKEPQNFASNAYDAIMLIAKAMEKYGFNAEAVKRGLYEVKNYHGASGVFSVNENGDVEQKMLIMIIKDGKVQLYK